ncbi:PKD domain-containing protein [Rhodonellum ikkaensis]|nr:PKD domain-containing protein [Rhodonellum ikkaensis]
MLMLPVVFLAACIEEYSLTDEAPTADQAAFNFQATADSDNILNFTADQEFFLMNWDLGNGATATGKTAQGIYPSAGTYTVTLTVFSRGGSVSSSREVVIEKTDPLLLDRPIFNFLTGGVEALNGKTWVLDSAATGHFGVGPDPSQAGDFPEYYQAGPNEKAGGGMYDDRYTFVLNNFGFIMKTNGNVYINAAQGSNFSGAVDSGVGDLRAPYNPPAGLTWNIVEADGAYPELTISNGGFIGYFAGTRTYQIINIEENQLFLRFVDQANEGLAWYIRLIPAGFQSGGGNEPAPVPQPEPEPTPGEVNITLQNLVGANQKAWKLKPAVKAFGVGPAPGSDAFFPNGLDISADRACLFNDEFIFGQDGFFAYDAKGDVYGEGYLGISDGCQEESKLTGTAGAAWASGEHKFSFTPGTSSAKPKITVTGTGAFIVLPKAFNGGEYTAGPPQANRSVTYDVIGYVNEGDKEELTITIDITNNGGVFWTFVLIPA